MLDLWQDLGPARVEDYHDLHEYIMGDMNLLASPKDLLLIEEHYKEDEQFAEIIDLFFDTDFRGIMFARMWQFIDTQIEYRLKNGAGPYGAAYGTRGMGKSEVLAYMLLRILKAYLRYTTFSARPALARNPSEANTLLSNATEAALKIILHIDEAEDEVGTGSRTEEIALLNNLETIRVLMHSILRCTIRLRKMIQFAEQADFVLHTLFQDRINKINYCMIYVYDDKVSRLRPVGIIDVPLHTNSQFRQQYEARKLKDQMEFTTWFGRTSPLNERLDPIIKRLVDYIFKIGEEWEITSHGQLESPLIRNKTKVGGGILNGDERRIAMKIAFDEIKERRKGKPNGDDVDPLKGITWDSEFTWRAEMATLMEEHSKWRVYHPFFLAKEVELLKPSRDKEAFNEITGRSVARNYEWLRKMDEDKSFRGWMKAMRSQLHEKYVANRLREAGFKVKEKPQFQHEGQLWIEDLRVGVNDEQVWINTKCGSGFRTYVNSEYKTTFILHRILKKETYILYLDLETMQNHIHIPGDSIAVGGTHTSTIFGKGLDKIENVPESSTPHLLLEALATKPPEVKP